MKDILAHGFNAVHALRDSSFSDRVQPSAEQHLLDIVEKERANVLPWRGQFSPQLIEYLLAKHCREGQRILDPFCGSGTVLREAARAKLNALGMDINPAAVCLAKVSELVRIRPEHRNSLVERMNDFFRRMMLLSSDNVGVVDVEAAAKLYFDFDFSEIEKIAIEGALLFLFSHGKYIDKNKIAKGLERYLLVAFDSHSYNLNIEARVGDARAVDEAGSSFDYLVTSPPYINVFNYHQNYRPIIEALGYKPLSAARSEIGANRKFRQNRYMTVVQYCMDMAEFFVESSRVLKEGAKVSIVLGRESNVRSVPFKNGELIGAIVCEGMGYELVEWNERKFINRFGEYIYEDVLTLIPHEYSLDKAIEIGREVGTQALINALEYCPDERKEEISKAISSASTINPSPLN